MSNEDIQHYKTELWDRGVTHIKDFIPKNLRGHLLDIVQEQYVKTGSIKYNGTPIRDDKDLILYNLQNKSLFFIDLLTLNLVSNICREFLNDPYYRFLPDTVGNYILNFYNARSSGRALDLHIDTWMPFPGKKTSSLQFGFVLDDMDSINGCTIFCPGSHTSGKYPDREQPDFEVVPWPAKAGDLIIWDSRIWHGTLANTANQRRWLLIATFSCWWMKQKMNIPRGLPNKIYKMLSLEQKILLGFASIPPTDERDRVNTKVGFEDLLPTVGDYFQR